MSAGDVLRNLQKKQYDHDKKAHQDVLYLPLPDRMAHFALHLAKYTGRLAQGDIDEAAVKRAAIDAFVICLAASNALKVPVTDYFDQSEQQGSIAALGLALGRTEKLTKEIVRDWYFRQLALGSGELAKACEYLQHLEPAPYRELILDSLARVCRASIVMLTFLSADVETVVAGRWQEIEERQR